MMTSSETTRSTTTWAPRALIATALAGPVYPTWVVMQQLQIGRVLLLVTIAAIAYDVTTGRAGTLRPWRALAFLVAGLGGLLVWTALSAATWGCFCSGSTQGFGDLVVLTVVASVVALYMRPSEALWALGAAAVGALVAGLLSAADIRDLHANVFAVTGSEGRLQGVYGNSNFLGFALALALPAGLLGALRLTGPRRAIAAVAMAGLAVLLYLTYSRGSLIAAAFGVAALLWFVIAGPQGTRPGKRLAVGVAVLVIPALSVALITTPFYRDARLRADFGAQVDAPVEGPKGPGGPTTQKEALHGVESDYVDSRSTGARLAHQAFDEQPIRGIGMDRFPYYADERAEFGELPTHNYYAQVAAELGLVGIALALLAGLTVVVSLLRGTRPLLLRAVTAGTVVVGIVNLVFINGLASPGMTMPLSLAIAFAVGWAGATRETDGSTSVAEPRDHPIAAPAQI